jgi:trigger factor
LLQAVEDISSTKKRLRIEIPSDIIEQEVKDYLEKLRQKTKIPGFRPGRAPIHLIEKRFGKGVEAEVLEKVVPEFYSKALKEADLRPVTMPVLDEKLEFKRNSPLNFSLTVEVMPKIENLDYSSITARDIPVTVDETEIEDYLKKLREGKAIYEVAEKEIEKNDLVTFDYIDHEIVGEETSLSLKEKIAKMGKEILPMDIEEKLIGKKKGETAEFTHTFNEASGVKELTGKTMKVKIEIKEVKRKILPTIDDEFAKDLGFENISELREKMKENLLMAKKEQASKIQKAEILRKIIESHDFEVPETILRNEFESLLFQASLSDAKDKSQDAVKTQTETGIMDLTSGESMPEEGKKDTKNLETELRERALRNVRASILIDAIGQREAVVVTEDEVKNRINLIAQQLSSKPEAVMKFYIARDGSLEGIRRSIYEEKVLDLLMAKATFEKGE